MKSKIIALVGPTASGKTDLAKKLSRDNRFIIFSVDSRQIYRQLDIGTGKDTSFQQIGLDLINPGEKYSVEQFLEYILPKIQTALKQKKILVLVGGTFFWLEAILYRNSYPQVKPDYQLRAQLETQTTDQLHRRLKEIDPPSAQRIGHHRRRLIRALEIVSATDNPIPSLARSPRFNHRIFGIKPNKKELIDKIKQRFDGWLENGLLDEVKMLLKLNQPDFIRELGLHYVWLVQYISGEISLADAKAKSQTALYHYAKRQLTYLKRLKPITWVKNFRQLKIAVDEFVGQP